MRTFACLFIAALCMSAIWSQESAEFSGETVSFSASDGVRVTADLYLTEPKSATFIILYHQAGYSRGEYLEIAPKLNELGFNCMAVDQRSGDQVNGVINQTKKEALRLNLDTEYIDALPDIEAAYLYVKHSIKPDKIIIWGSSYSAAISFFMGATHHKNVSAILAFAPGEYFKINGKAISQWATRVTCPVFVTSAKSEYSNWKTIYQNLQTDKSYFLPESEGKHGSKALWVDNQNHQAYWDAVITFLNKIK